MTIALLDRLTHRAHILLGYLLYPGKHYGIDGPLGTVRLAMVREGNEDLEYFWLYRTLAEQAGLSDEVIEAQVQSLIEPLARNLRDWERDPRLLYKQREAVAQQIIELLPQ
ncbi:MAG: hypothetical protein ACOX4G_08685 [Limnochordia bacterium]|jgi:hypothetical protein